MGEKIMMVWKCEKNIKCDTKRDDDDDYREEEEWCKIKSEQFSLKSTDFHGMIYLRASDNYALFKLFEKNAVAKRYIPSRLILIYFLHC
jgi:hypothetical protein